MERNDFSNFGRVSHNKYFYEIILQSTHLPRRRCHLNVFFLFLALDAILFSGANNFSNLGRGLPEKHFCEIILKSGHWPRRRCPFNFFFYF